jgi:EF-P beta-lysylation protein EpmB
MKAIIPQVVINQQQTQWQDELKNLFTQPLELLNYLELDPQTIPWISDLNFPLRVPRNFAKKMVKGDPHDPLLKQVLSIDLESQKSTFSSSDPLQESHFNPVPGLLHKYDSRVLLTFTPSCAVHCRYCFRIHFPYTANNPGKAGWQVALDYIRDRPEIVEVILSGGDPLMATNAHIESFLKALSTIEHVKMLRFHTRLPVVIPSRIDENLVDMLCQFRFQTTMIYHINHPNEIDRSITQGVSLLRKNAITVLNQSVLLKGINDNLACLKRLSLDLFTAGILPYYMHLLDPVEGAEHFLTHKENAQALQAALRGALPGYLVPRFVQEIPGEKSKVSL